MADGAATQLEKIRCLVIAVESTDSYGPAERVVGEGRGHP